MKKIFMVYEKKDTDNIMAIPFLDRVHATYEGALEEAKNIIKTDVKNDYFKHYLFEEKFTVRDVHENNRLPIGAIFVVELQVEGADNNG